MANPHVEVLIDCAANSRLAVLYYKKTASAKQLQPRLIEPYNFAYGKEDLMIRCFQLQHGEDSGEAGWRYFMAHKVERTEPTSILFKPRRKITLPTGEAYDKIESDPNWVKPGRKEYRDLLSDVLSVGRVTPFEVHLLSAAKDEHDLSIEDVRFIHASMYHRCLECILKDGDVSDSEVQEIKFLHESLRTLGWSPGD